MWTRLYVHHCSNFVDLFFVGKNMKIISMKMLFGSGRTSPKDTEVPRTNSKLSGLGVWWSSCTTPGSATHKSMCRVTSRCCYLSLGARRQYANGMACWLRWHWTRGPHIDDGRENEITRGWLMEMWEFLPKVPKMAAFLGPGVPRPRILTSLPPTGGSWRCFETVLLTTMWKRRRTF